MKRLIACILTFVLLFAGLANAAETMMMCSHDHEESAAQSTMSDSDVHMAFEGCSHEEKQSDHKKDGDHSRSASRCASMCCGSLCFIPTQVSLELFEGRISYGASPPTIFVNVTGKTWEISRSVERFTGCCRGR